MLKLVKIAVTGIVAAGKSTVCDLLKEHGAYVIEADELVHKILMTNKTVQQQIINLLGTDIVEHKHLNRLKIAAKVFNNPKKLKILEDIIHPIIFDEIDDLYKKATKDKKYTFFVVEMPLLYETGREKDFDYVIFVQADETICENRLRENKKNIENYKKRIKRQLSAEEKAHKAEFFIQNNTTINDLREKVKNICTQIQKER